MPLFSSNTTCLSLPVPSIAPVVRLSAFSPKPVPTVLQSRFLSPQQGLHPFALAFWAPRLVLSLLFSNLCVTPELLQWSALTLTLLLPMPRFLIFLCLLICLLKQGAFTLWDGASVADDVTIMFVLSCSLEPQEAVALRSRGLLPRKSVAFPRGLLLCHLTALSILSLSLLPLQLT